MRNHKENCQGFFLCLCLSHANSYEDSIRKTIVHSLYVRTNISVAGENQPWDIQTFCTGVYMKDIKRNMASF